MIRQSMKSQYSLEYILTIGFFLAILLAFVGVYFMHQRSSAEEIDTARVNAIGNEIIDSIKTLRGAGGYSVKEINLGNIDYIEAIYIEGNYSNTIVINYTGGSASFFADTKVAGLVNSSLSPSTLYIMKDNTGDLALCSLATCRCKPANCCSLAPIYCHRGECRNGTSLCTMGSMTVCAGEIRPVPEIPMNGKDDDCDGSTS